jgi:CheY-like chemotaxis protein
MQSQITGLSGKRRQVQMRKILIIEDDEIFRNMLAKGLTLAGFNVFTAVDGKEGTALCKTVLPDLVITDIIMPEQDGLETIMQIKRDFPQIPMFAISGTEHGRSLYLKVARQLGANRTFEKPLSIAQLIGAVAEVAQ